MSSPCQVFSMKVMPPSVYSPGRGTQCPRHVLATHVSGDSWGLNAVEVGQATKVVSREDVVNIKPLRLHTHRDRAADGIGITHGERPQNSRRACFILLLFLIGLCRLAASS